MAEDSETKPWGKWLAFVAIGLITISLISFTNSMDDIENLVDPEQNNSGIIEPGSNQVIELQANRIYTMLRIVENINNEAELDLEITDSENNKVSITKPTWMQPQRSGDGGKVIYDPVGTITLDNVENLTFKNSNSTSTVYIVDDQSVDLQAFQEPGIFLAFISCCFGLIILPLSLIIHLIIRKKGGIERVALQGMPTNRIPTTDELFLIREGKMNPQDVKGVQRTRSVPPPFAGTRLMKSEHVNSENLTEKVEGPSRSKIVKQQVDANDEDWQSWDSG